MNAPTTLVEALHSNALVLVTHCRVERHVVHGGFSQRLALSSSVDNGAVTGVNTHMRCTRVEGDDVTSLQVVAGNLGA